MNNSSNDSNLVSKTISELSPLIKAPKIPNLSNKLLKYLTRNAYLHIGSNGYGIGPKRRAVERDLIMYLFYIDGQYIRRFNDIPSITYRHNVVVAKYPTASNIVKMSSSSYIYYNMQTIVKAEDTYYNIDIYFFGADRYKERHNAFAFFNRYRTFIRNKPLSSIRVHRADGSVSKMFKSKDNIISDKIDYITDGVRRWDKMKDWYNDHHIMHKLGILLYGPPGTGKTSMVNYITGVLRLCIISIDITEPLSDIKKVADKYNQILSSGVYLFEDVDLLFGNTDDAAVLAANQEKTQWLLQFMDGMESPEGSFVVCLTTNYVERIDPRLLRKGRIDLKVHLDNFNMDEAVALCKNFQVDPNVILRDMTLPINPAELQSKCIEECYRLSIALIEGGKE